MSPDEQSPKTITKESLWARLELATTVAELDEVRADALSIGHAEDGQLLTRVAERRAALEG